MKRPPWETEDPDDEENYDYYEGRYEDDEENYG